MNGVDGVADVMLEQQMDIPFVRFVLNRGAMARYGLTVQHVAEANRNARRHSRSVERRIALVHDNRHVLIGL